MISENNIDVQLTRVAMASRADFRALYTATAPRLFGLAARIVQDDALAEDILQEVYTTVWSQAGRYRPEDGSGLIWLIGLTRNVATRRLRDMRDTGMAPVSVEIAERLYDPQPDASEVSSDEAKTLAVCLRELPSDRADMLRRAYLEGRSYADIATATGVEPDVIRTRLRRSLMQLRECLSR